jgi:hypothetical protein
LSTSTYLTRYLARVDELEALRQKLESQNSPSDPGPIVGRVLEAAGDVFRRSQKVPHDAAAVDRVLNLISAAALLSWEQGAALDGLAQRLSRTADEAVESALPDASDDGHSFAAWALEGLSARDRLESALVALKRLAALGRKEASEALTRLTPKVDALDKKSKRSARALTALNPARREEVALLDASVRARAWWYGELDSKEHDGLVRALGGEGDAPRGAAERAVSDLLEQRHRRKVNQDELFRYDLGIASPAEVAIIERQAKEDPELARALAAMADAERAIADLDGPPLKPVKGDAPAKPSSPSVRVLEDRPEATVLLMRRKAKLVLVLQPHKEKFAAAAVYLGARAEKPLKGRHRSDGLEYDLGAEEKLSGVQVRAVLKLNDGNERELSFALP